MSATRTGATSRSTPFAGRRHCHATCRRPPSSATRQKMRASLPMPRCPPGFSPPLPRHAVFDYFILHFVYVAAAICHTFARHSDRQLPGCPAPDTLFSAPTCRHVDVCLRHANPHHHGRAAVGVFHAAVIVNDVIAATPQTFSHLPPGRHAFHWLQNTMPCFTGQQTEQAALPYVLTGCPPPTPTRARRPGCCPPPPTVPDSNRQ